MPNSIIEKIYTWFKLEESLKTKLRKKNAGDGLELPMTNLKKIQL